jgi:hypothetical protein
MLEFVAIGRSVSGAAGNVRATNVVHLEEAADGGTRVLLEGDVALGGMLGSVGQKVVAKQAGKITRSFAEALEREISGGGEPEPATPSPAVTAGPIVPAAASTPAPRESAGAPKLRVAAGAVVVAALLFALRRLLSR